MDTTVHPFFCFAGRHADFGPQGMGFGGREFCRYQWNGQEGICAGERLSSLLFFWGDVEVITQQKVAFGIETSGQAAKEKRRV